MEYDGYGNITAKNEDVYTYDNAKWKDLLTKVGNQTISYDNQGNPISYLGHTLTWEKGRQLKSFDNNIYTYNANGIRTSKTINGIKHSYVLDGTKILKETWGNNVLIPLYDNEENVCGIEYNGTAYWFYKNLQGDIISIANADGDVIANYNYDAWGRLCSIIDTDGNATTDSTNIAIINPFRYRGYYYDTEIGMYYLQSRYYDPTVGRFINADDTDYLGANKISLGYNLFTYCENEPILKIDCEGYAPRYKGIVGFGLQIAITADVLWCQGFWGMEVVWFPKCNNNFRNGIIPWIYCYSGGSIGRLREYNKLITPTILTDPKKVICGMSISFSFSLSITCFLVTAVGRGISKADDYNGKFTFWTGTVWGVTVSKAWSDTVVTYGVGLSWEVGLHKRRLSFGKKLFGSTGGCSNYIRLNLKSPSQSLYNSVKGRV